jgi:hypothetical protein
MNKHVMVVVHGAAGVDGSSAQCLGCGQYMYGSLTQRPLGECPTPYKSPAQLLAESVAREAALREELAQLRRWEQMIRENSPLVQRLTAAEQRNAELVAGIVSLPEDFKELSGCENTAGVYACIDYISDWVAALQSTESGASDEQQN